MLGIVGFMPPTSLADELTEKLRESRFGQDFFGPRIAGPAAKWLATNFVEVAPNGEGEDTAGIQLEDALGSAVTDPVPEPDGLGTVDPHLATTVEDVSEQPLDLTPTSPKAMLALLKALGERVKNHNLVVVAAGIAFWGLLAIPAILFATVSIAGLVLNPDTVKEQVETNLSGLPPEAQNIIAEQLEGVSGGSTGGLITGLIFGILLALWTSSGAMAKLMGALNTIFNTTETRKFFKLRGTAIGLTFGGIVFISSAIFLLAAMPPILSSVDAVGESAATLFNWLRFPLLGLVMVFALGVLYHVGPDQSASYRPLSVGAAVAMVLWITLSALFTIYTSTVGKYNETYGSIGGIVILLLWLFITAFVVLLGAEIHAIKREL